MQKQASQLVKEIEDTKYTGEVILRFKEGGLSDFVIPINKNNISKTKNLLDKLKKTHIIKIES